MPENAQRQKQLDELFRGDAFQSLPLALSARLAEGRISLAEVRDLVPGRVVPLDTPVGEASQLIAEGITIARGEIVEIQGRLEFRITGLGEEP
jgi:flagellar motor switch/type III secretory pathway protein FliN